MLENDEPLDAKRSTSDSAGDGNDAGGDGLHHHEIHEDEGGGYHSVHTHPDGTEDHDDHATYEEAKAKMDSDFGKGDDDGDEADGAGDGSSDGAEGYQKSCGM